MPHANNLDLAVFPSMSKRHSELVANCGSGVPSTEQIWGSAKSVWNELPSSTIARGFMQFYRILDLVIKHKGDNDFLQTNEFHTGVTKDYVNTTFGVKKRPNTDTK